MTADTETKTGIKAEKSAGAENRHSEQPGGGSRLLRLYGRMGPGLYRWRWLWIGSALLALAALVSSLLSADPVVQGWLLPAVVVLSWSGSLYGLGAGFHRPLPAVDPDDGLWQRSRIRLVRFWAWLLAWAFSLTSAGLLWLSLRTLSMLWRGDL